MKIPMPEDFFEVPKFYLELQKMELRSFPILSEIAGNLFKDIDSSKVLFLRESFEIIHNEDYQAIRILPSFASKRELELRQNGNEIILSMKNETRRFMVPKEFENTEIESAQFEQGYLVIVPEGLKRTLYKYSTRKSNMEMQFLVLYL